MTKVKIDDPSVDGVLLRNSKDLCAFAKCGNPLNSKGNHTGIGLVCDKCYQGMVEHCDWLRKEIIKDIDQEIFDKLSKRK